jgi:hypothetical protein
MPTLALGCAINGVVVALAASTIPATNSTWGRCFIP